MKWTSFLLEFHDWWLLFSWGHYVIFGEIGIVGSINELGFDSVYVIFLSVLWVILSIVLLISYFVDTRSNQFPTRGLIITLIILVLQILLPMIFLQFAMSSGAFITNITPIPAPSIVMVGVYSIHFVIMRRNDLEEN
jgi:hypothetical protein